jgi:hypothetical protein
VRKRDLELARLKSHLQGQQRGNKAAMTAPSINITGAARSKPALDASVHELKDPEYSLKQETTEFLTQLSQSLSDENDNLISLVRGALGTVRDLLGLPCAPHAHPDSAIGSMGSDQDKHGSSSMLHALPTSYDTLAADMEEALNHLKGVLSNPNFVTVEEVEVRQEEIDHLREGWEQMEQRWRDVLFMMDGWRKRMDTGDTINIDDLRRGMGLVSPDRMHVGEPPNEPEQSFVNGDSISEIRLPGIEEVSEPSVVLAPPILSSPAKSSPKRKRDVLEPPEFFDLRPKSVATSPQHVSEVDFEDDLDELAPEHDTSDPQMTVEEKLQAAQIEAEEAAATARVAATARADKAAGSIARSSASKRSRGAASAVPAPIGVDGTIDDEQDDTLGKMVSPMVRKTKIKGRPKRRKSTLNPEELEALLLAGNE